MLVERQLAMAVPAVAAPPPGAGLAVVLLLLLVLGAAAVVYWGAVWWQVARTARLLPTARRGLELPLPRPEPRVCVVVPAHNEEGVIAKVAASLLGQDYPALRVVFALDRCTDSTAARLAEAIGGDARFEVVAVTGCPPEWAGKVHAVWSAVEGAEGAPGAELLLFADADTVFEPGCVRAAVALLKERGLGMLSLLSTLTCERWFERVVQPMAGFELLRQCPPLKANKAAAERGRPFANGQFMLFERGAYEAAGGHAAVKGELLEDIALARKVVWGGGRAGLLFADGLLRCRMYAGWGAFVRGWKRIYTEAANRKPRRLVKNALVVAVTGAVLPVAGFAGGAVGTAAWLGGGGPVAAMTAVVGAAGVLAACGALLSANRQGGTPGWTVVLVPVGAVAVAGVLMGAAMDLLGGRATRWGGRAYTRPVR
jgi:hypothetical protein